MARVTDKTELARLKQAVSNALPLLEQALSNASSHTQEESKDNAVETIQKLRDALSTPKLDVTLQRPKVGVGVVVRDPSRPGEVLVGKRKGSHGASAYALPGGHLEGGEDWATTAMRELEEETGLKVSVEDFHFIHVTNDVMPEDDCHYITLFMETTVSNAEAKNLEPEKCEGWEWHPIDGLLGIGDLFIPLRHLVESGKLKD